MRIWNNNGAVLYLTEEEGGALVVGVGGENETEFGLPQIPFGYSTLYGDPGFCTAMTGLYRNMNGGMRCAGIRTVQDSLVLEYRCAEDGLRAEVFLEAVPAAACFRQRVRLTNEGTLPVTLTGLTNLLPFFGFHGEFDSCNAELWNCRQTWYGEGNWRRQSFEEAGIGSTGRNVPVTSSFSMASVGTQTTSKFFPNLFVRDNRRGECFFCELEPLGSWVMEVGIRRIWGESRGSAALFCGSAEERRLHFSRTLAPGESYEGAACAFGVVRGGAEQVVRELTKMRRRYRLRPPEDMPIVFNDYMNCLWADPDAETCLKLAKAAKEAGADAYVLDAGWFVDRGVGWNCRLGDWSDDSNRFEGGLESFLGRIRALGLLVGVWVEIEVCGRDARIFSKPDSWFVCRRGKRVGSDARKFFDFTNPEVRAYLLERLERLVSMGVRLFKNDYNDSYFACGGEETFGMQENLRAVYAFFDEFRARHPEVIVESCASGAMRSDGETLSHFAFQSVTDQDDARRYPAIVKGALMNILPEQLGVWCMPCPMRSGEDEAACRSRFKGAESTVFDFVCGLAGLVYLSGRIDLCDGVDFTLVKEGVALAKSLSGFVRTCYPEFPTGLAKCGGALSGWETLALSDERGEEKLLFVWRLGGESERLEIPLGGRFSAEQIYPADRMTATYETVGSSLAVTLPEPFTARLFRIKAQEKTV